MESPVLPNFLFNARDSITSPRSAKNSVREFVERRTNPQNSQTRSFDNLDSKPEVDWYTIPADLTLAKSLAKRPKVLDSNGKEINVCSSKEEFSKISLSHEIFAELHPLLNKVWIVLLVVGVLTEGIGYAFCTKLSDIEEYRLTKFFSITLRCEENTPLVVMKAVVSVIGMIIILYLINTARKKIAWEYDIPLKQNLHSESQFCLLMKGVPTGAREAGLEQWIASSLKKDIKVRGFLFVRSPVTLYKAIKAAKRKKQMTKSQKYAEQQNDFDAVSLLTGEFNDGDKEQKPDSSPHNESGRDSVQALLRRPSDSASPDFTGTAIVCFEKKKNRDAVYEFFSKRTNSAETLFQNTKISFELPPAPHNVDWNNIHKSRKYRNTLKIASWITIAIIWSVTLACLWVYYVKLQTEQSLLPFIFILSIIVVLKQIVNGVILLFSKLICFDCKSTREVYKLNLRLFFSYLVFTVSQLACILNNFHNAGWLFTLSSLALFPINLINPLYDLGLYLYRKMVTKFVEWQGSNNRLTQQEANNYYKNPGYNFLDRVSDASLAYYMALSLSLLFPIVIPITFVAYLYGVWIDKFLIVKFYSVPTDESFKRSLKAFRIFTFTFFLQVLGMGYYLGTVITQANKHEEPDKQTENFAKGFIFALIPAVLLYYIIFFRSSKNLRKEYGLNEESLDLTYEGAKDHLFSTYWEHYPYRSNKIKSF